ncbi:MAG TPA: radical SAM protein, partial [Pyrinomonadaceae bacterium]|nr:radical SAM protein [Pyrinomonadaceae bacterium]
MASKSNLQIDESTLPRLAGILNTRILELILLPTEKCNFRCTYCYEDFEMGRMSPEIILGIKNLILNRANDLDRLQLSWFGGEPLAALDVVLEVSGFAAQLAAKKSHLNYRAHMTTNASLLDPATFDKLVDVGVLDYQITLDGPREIHNQTRVQAGGGGTFDRIWNNLLAIRATNLPASIHLRIHFDSETAYRMGP